MRFETVERPPNFELGYWGQTIERWFSEGMPKEAYPWDYIDKRVMKGNRAIIKRGAHDYKLPMSEIEFLTIKNPLYGHDYFGIERRPCLPLKFGPIPSFKVRVHEETNRYTLYRDRDGILRKALKEGTVRSTRPSMDTYINFPVKDREDFEKMKERYDPYDPRRYPSNWSQIVEYYRERDVPLCLVPNGTIGFYSMARRWMGTEALSKAFFTKPNLVREIMDFVADFIIEVSDKALHDIHPDYFNFFEDFAYKGGPHFSPRIFKEFMLPCYKRVTDFLRKHGVNIIWLDSDGNIEVLIPLLMEAGITCIWPLEIAAEMDPHKIRHEYGHDMVLSGGIDKREIAKGKKAIEHEVMSKVPELVSEGGYIPTLDHSFPPDISYENFLYYLEVKLEAMTK
jgi:uroporphyrinogen decarboxylase